MCCPADLFYCQMFNLKGRGTVQVIVGGGVYCNCLCNVYCTEMKRRLVPLTSVGKLCFIKLSVNHIVSK